MEFLGDAVVEFLTTVHLFFLFTELDEGGLATFRSALVNLLTFIFIFIPIIFTPN
jgi:dsRNA-specific ribonuclease